VDESDLTISSVNQRDVHDHIIVGKDGYASLKDLKLI